MKHKILISILVLTLLFSTTPIYALEKPEEPKINGKVTNEKIEQYNKEAKDYNKKVDEYNKKVKDEHQKEVEEINKKNEEGAAIEKKSKEEYDAAVAENEKAKTEAEETNLQIDEDNKNEEERVNNYNLNEDLKYQDSVQEKERIESINTELKNQYNQNVKEAEEEYQAALIAEDERINGIKEKNKQIRQNNEEQKQKALEVEQYNLEESARIEQSNKEKQESYEKQKEQYQKDYEQYQKDLAKEQQIIAAGYSSVEQYNNVIINHNNTVDKAIEENAVAAPFNMSKAYKVIPSDNPTGTKVKVHIEHSFIDIDSSFVEDLEIDFNDTIIFYAAGAQMKTTKDNYASFYYNGGENYSQGYWISAGSVLMDNAVYKEDGWDCGDNHTISYKQGKNHPFDITDIDMVYYYAWNPLKKYKTYNIPQLPTEPTLELEEFVPIIFNPIYENELDETRIEVFKKSVEIPSYLDVPSIYKQQYLEYIPKEHVAPILKEVPEVLTWTALAAPSSPVLLNHLPLFKLLPIKAIVSNKTKSVRKNSNTANAIFTSNNSNSDGLIDEEENKGTEIIQEEQVPLVASDPNKWALLNLIILIVIIIIFLFILFAKPKKEEEEEKREYYNYEKQEEEDKKDFKRFKLLSLLVSVVSVIFFILTEDMTLPIQLIDKWTIIMVIFLIDQILLELIILRIKGTRKGEKKQNE